MLFQSVQDRRRVPVFVSRVKGEVNDLFPGGRNIVGVEGGQLFAGGVSLGRRTGVPEFKAPALA